MQRNEQNYETIPAGSLGVIPLESCRKLGKKVDKYLVRFRRSGNMSTRTTLPSKDTTKIPIW